MRTLIPFAFALAFGAGLAAAAPPALFAKSQPGLWELSGLQGTKAPARLCIADLSQLAQVEHRGRSCKPKAIRGDSNSATFTYECSAKDFGSTDIDFVTPRSFRIVSQGIAGGLPFAHTVQARRIGDCPTKPAPSRH